MAGSKTIGKSEGLSKAKRAEQDSIQAELGRLHKLSALLACLQHAVNYDVGNDLRVDVSDALAAVVMLIDHEIHALDRVEAAS